MPKTTTLEMSKIKSRSQDIDLFLEERLSLGPRNNIKPYQCQCPKLGTWEYVMKQKKKYG